MSMKGQNNPGNIRVSSIPWRGKLPPTGPFENFDTLENGVRALMLCTLAAYRQHDCRTVEAYIEHYAPASDNNPTAAYASFVADFIDAAPTDMVDFAAPAVLRLIAIAQSWFETNTMLAPTLVLQASKDAIAA